MESKIQSVRDGYRIWSLASNRNWRLRSNKGGVEGGFAFRKTETEFDKNDKKNIILNSKAILMLQSALSQKEYFRICNLSTAKEMWKALEVAYEGTFTIKENRINTLTTEYDLL